MRGVLYTQKQIDDIIELGKTGLSDVKIAKQLNVSYSKTQRVMSNYWKEQMKNKLI